jgi:hypothetical protein
MTTTWLDRLIWITLALIALAYVCLWAWIIAGMQREPMTTTSVRPDVPAHQLSVNPMQEWR